MGAHVAFPDNTPAGAIIAIMEIWGVNDTMRRHAQEFAEAGFVCLVPDLFWRQEPGVELSDRNPEHVKKAFDLYYDFDYDLGVRDMEDTSSFLKKMPGATARWARVGYCLGGKLCYLMCCRTDIDCAVAYYGTYIEHRIKRSEEPPSPLHAAHGDEGPLGAGRGERPPRAAPLAQSAGDDPQVSRRRPRVRAPRRPHLQQARSRPRARAVDGLLQAPPLMRILWNEPIRMDDGIELRADVYLPEREARYPVILSCGPYGKGYAFQESNAPAWEALVSLHPEILEGSSNKYQAWEVVDPEKWVPEGYAIVRVDSRGAGASPGLLDPWSARETQDLYHCIEWAGTQSWSNGRVGLNGISYYAMNAWQVACLQPPHLAAFCAWEGSSDHYREALRHGGIASRFLPNWFVRSVQRVQHGLGERGPKSRATGEPVCGPDLRRRAAREPARLRALPRRARARRRRVPRALARLVEGEGAVPLRRQLGRAGAAHARQLRGLPARRLARQVARGARRRALGELLCARRRALQRRFFGHFLKGEDTGWTRQPRVELKIRHPGEKFVVRHESEWPLARTRWTRFYLILAG